MCWLVCLSVYLLTSFVFSICLHSVFNLCVCQSSAFFGLSAFCLFCLSVCLCVSVSIYLSIHSFICQSVCYYIICPSTQKVGCPVHYTKKVFTCFLRRRILQCKVFGRCTCKYTPGNPIVLVHHLRLVCKATNCLT